MTFASIALAAALQAAAPLVSHGAAALSPAGDKVALLETRPAAAAAGKPDQMVVVRAAKDGRELAVYDPCQDCRYGAPAWSADGKGLAFVATREGEAAVDVVTDGKVRTLTTIKGLAQAPRWSPDGKAVAVLATPGAKKLTGAAQAGVRQVGEIGLEGAQDSQRIAIVAVAGGEPTYVSPDGTFVYEYDWTPDGAGFVATAAKGDGDNNWWVAKLMAYPIGGEGRVIAAPKFQINYPRVSPDGKNVAVLGGLMSDFGVTGGDIHVAPFAGGELVNVTPGYKGTFTSLVWKKPGVAASVLVGGESGAALVDPAGKAPVKVWWKAPLSIAAADGKLSFDAQAAQVAYVAEGFEKANYLAAGPVAAPRIIADPNAAVAPSVKAQSVNWTNEGFNVQGWLLSPTKVEPGKTYPLLVYVHGGPSSASLPKFANSGATKALLDKGYFILQPNPRGSFGQGEAFKRSNARDFGGGDLRDILAGVDAAAKTAPIDVERLGIYGGSYGGFMTLWAVGHTDRFKAAVSGAPVANWISYYGQNGIDQWMIPFFGASAYDDPAIYDQLSPVRYLKNAKTPTFLYVGERDVETPAAQALEFWHGLRAMNVPTSLVIYPDEGHHFRNPDNNKDVSERLVAWFDKYLAAK